MIPLFASTALAGAPLEEAQAKRAKAFNDFYDKYKASQRTPEDAKAIGDQTITPMSSSTSRAIAQEKQSALRNTNINVTTQAEAVAAHERESKALDEAEANAAAAGPDAASGKDGDKGEDGKPAGEKTGGGVGTA